MSRFNRIYRIHEILRSARQPLGVANLQREYPRYLCKLRGCNDLRGRSYMTQRPRSRNCISPSEAPDSRVFPLLTEEFHAFIFPRSGVIAGAMRALKHEAPELVNSEGR